MYGEYFFYMKPDTQKMESSPRVRGIHLLVRVNTPQKYISHSLYAMDELRILLNGDPQTN